MVNSILNIIKTYFKSKKAKVGLAILSFLIVLLIATKFILIMVVENIFHKEIEKLAAHKIFVTYDQLNVKVLSRSIIIYHISIKSNDRELPATQGMIEYIKIKGISIYDIIFNKTFHINRLVFNTPNVKTYNIKNYFKDKDSEEEANQLVRNIRIDQVDFDYLDWSNLDSVSSKKMNTICKNLSIKDVAIYDIDQDSVTWTIAGFSSKDLIFDIPSKYYKFGISDITYQSKQKKLIIDKVNILPYFSEEDFGKQLGRKIARFSGDAKAILEGVQIGKEKQIYLKASAFNCQFNLEIYKDQRLPQKITTIKPLFREIFKSTNFKFDFHNVTIDKSYVEYKELNANQSAPGMVFFTDIELKSPLLSNLDTVKELNNHVSAKFMNQGLVDFTFNIPMQTGQKYFLKGGMESFDLQNLNSILKNSLNMESKSGTATGTLFSFEYDENGSIGELSTSLNDINMVIMKKKNNKVSLFKSFILNKMIDKKTNNKPKLVGKINYKRNINKSVFNLWWKSILNGLLSALDINQDEPNVQVDEIQLE